MLERRNRFDPRTREALLQEARRVTPADFWRVCRRVSEHDSRNKEMLLQEIERVVSEAFDTEYKVEFELTLSQHPISLEFDFERETGEETSLSDEEEYDSETLRCEISKRLIINSLIQGGSFLGCLALIPELKLPADVKNDYRLFMVSSFEQFWIFVSNRGMRLENVSRIEGLVEIDNFTDEDSESDSLVGFQVVRANAVCGPVLLHEAIKGVLEVVGLWGLPGASLNPAETPEVMRNYFKGLRRKVLLAADRIEFEPASLVLGVDVWPEVIDCDCWRQAFSSKLDTASLLECGWDRSLESLQRFCLQPADTLKSLYEACGFREYFGSFNK